MKAKILILVLVVLISCVTMIATSNVSTAISDGTISGHVYDADTKQPLSQAFVYCQEVKCSKPTTNGTGYYATDPCFSASKTYRIQCTKHGYKTVIKRIMTDKDGKALADFNLEIEGSKPVDLQANQLPLSSGSISNSQEASAWVDKGNTLEVQSKHDEAIQAYDKAIEIDSKYAPAWTGKGLSLNMLGKYDEAINCFDKSIDIAPDNVDAWRWKGTTLGNSGKYDEAIKAYDRAIEIDPRNASIWAGKAEAFDKQGKYDEAIKAYDKAIEVDTKGTMEIMAHCNRAGILLKLSKFNESIEECDKCHELQPYMPIFIQKGNALVGLGRYDEAIQCYDKIIEDYSNVDYAKDFLSLAWNNKGITLQKMGRNLEAETSFAKAKELGHKHSWLDLA